MNPRCVYCGSAATSIRVSVTLSGDCLVATMCERHLSGEKEHAMSGGMVVVRKKKECEKSSDGNSIVLVDQTALENGTELIESEEDVSIKEDRMKN